jgi:N-acyl-D-aspartate/D-glutamate deacylase
MFDTIIRGGTVVDGNGTSPFIADVGIRDGVITDIAPRISGAARETVDADGHIVTPGFIDVHTHYDGQVSWDDTLDPSFEHGVTTAIMGNCGCGFAPVAPGGEARLIDVMEGVEDIPGTALYEGVPWGAWESFPEYLDYLATKRYTMDIGTHITHGALRVYVMGERGVFSKHARSEDIDQMAALVAEGMAAGAMGFSTNRIIAHRGVSGEPVPGTFAADDEMLTIASAMRDSRHGVVQMIPASVSGKEPNRNADPHAKEHEVSLMGEMSRRSGKPVTFTMFQNADDPEEWRGWMALAQAEDAAGARLFPQIPARPPGLVTGLSGYHAFQRRESYLPIAHLPLDDRARLMRDPALKAKILADQSIPAEPPGSNDNVYQYIEPRIARLHPLGSRANYEPEIGNSVGERAKASGRTLEEVLYDLYLEDEGRAFLLLAEKNFIYNDHETIRELLLDPHTLQGLGDAGAHMKYVCDASIPSYALSHWVRDRTRGDKLPIETIVAKLSAANADFYGMNDRGRLMVGKRADINVIDMKRLELSLPQMRWDLPQGAGRLVQPVTGYKVTMKSGEITRRDDTDTGSRPGRLIRGNGFA